MYAVETYFPARGSLREALLETFAEGGLFVEGHFDVTSGSPLIVRVSTAGLPVGVFLDGMVQWRRVAARGATATAPGLGVRLLPSERVRYAFLQSWAGGTADGSGRTEWRFPVESKIQLASASSRGTGRLMHSTLRDVGTHGAMVLTPTRLSVGDMVLVEVPFNGRFSSVSARVAWATEDRAGLRLALERPEERATWGRVVEHARATYAQRVLSPRRPSTPSVAPPRGTT